MNKKDKKKPDQHAEIIPFSDSQEAFELEGTDKFDLEEEVDLADVLQELEDGNLELEQHIEAQLGEHSQGFIQYFKMLELCFIVWDIIKESPDLDPNVLKHAKMVHQTESNYAIGTSMTPIWDSFFNCWAFFDVKIEKTDETLGQFISTILADMPESAPILSLLEEACNSRLGFYLQVERQDENTLVLKDLLTNELLVTDILFSGSEDGQILFGRLFPNLNNDRWVCIQTPYIVNDTTPQDVTDYLQEHKLLDKNLKPVPAANEFFKQGPSKYYWFDYIAQQAEGQQEECILLDGLPL